MLKYVLGVVGGIVASGAVAGYPVAHAQNASLTVYMRAAGQGKFYNTTSSSTQVNVFAVSGVAAKYNSSPILYAPATMTAAGTAFNYVVPNLYSPVLAPGNTYQIRLAWTDNADKQQTLGFYTLAPGNNSLGSGGLGSTTPIDIINDPPPAAKNLSCYPDLPDRSSQLYVYWSGVLLGQAKDLNRTELHRSTVAGFSPSAATLIATPPYGTDSRKLTGLNPATDYYFCVRVIDNYGAFTDTCRALACTTAMATPGVDGGAALDGGSGSEDGGSTPGADGGSGGPDDLGAGSGDDGGTGSGEDSGAGSGEGDLGQLPRGSIAVGCGCSLIPSSLVPGWFSLLPVAAVLLRRRRRPGR